MEKIKVCYLVSSLCNEGPVNVMYNIIKYIDFTLFDISIITFIPEKKTSRIQEFKQLPINIYQLSNNRFLDPLTLYIRLRQMVKKLSPDILHTHCLRSMFLVPFLPKKYKKIETVHIYPGIQQIIMYGKIKGKIIIKLSNFFTKRMDIPIACSESVAQSYWNEQHFKMKAIPNGCSLPLWKTNYEQKIKLRHKFNLKDDIKYFIFIGRFSNEKHPEMIIKAFELINNPHLGVILLGDGNLYNELKKHEKGNILLPGFKTNVYEYLIAADYYISASDIEGLANTLLESMTVGLPCVLSNIPSHYEVIAKTQQQIGYTFDNTQMDSMLKAINNILKLDYQSTSETIRNVFEKYYTAQHMSEQYQQTYIETIKKNKSKKNIQ